MLKGLPHELAAFLALFRFSSRRRSR